MKKSWNEIVLLLKSESQKSLTKQIAGLIMTSKELEDTSDQAFVNFFTKRCGAHTRYAHTHTHAHTYNHRCVALAFIMRVQCGEGLRADVVLQESL